MMMRGRFVETELRDKCWGAMEPHNNDLDLDKGREAAR